VFILYAVLVGIGLGLLLQGDPRRLASVEFRWWPVIVAGLFVQVVLFSPLVADRIGQFGVPIYVGSTLAVLVAVLRNVRLTGFPVVFAGGLSNFLAIVANGGYMPASATAMAAFGKESPETYSNSVVLAAPALEPLTDIFAMPRWLPFANVFSIGDVLIGIGVAWAIVAIMGARAAGPAEPRGNQQTDAAVHGARTQLTFVTDYPRTDSPLAPWDSRRSVALEGHPFLRWKSVQGKPVVRRGTQS
jgi:hypothetical protein